MGFVAENVDGRCFYLHATRPQALLFRCSVQVLASQKTEEDLKGPARRSCRADATVKANLQ